MDIFRLTCMAIAGVLSLAFGTRLLLLAYRSRGAPELLWGLAWMLSAIVNGFSALGDLAPSPTVHFVMRLLVAVFYPLTALILWVANWRLFRVRVVWAEGLCFFAVLALVACWVIELGFIGLDVPVACGWSLLRFYEHSFMLLGLGWTAAETWRQHGMLVKRWRIGLASRLLGVRYLLWSISALALVPVWALLWIDLVVPVSPWLTEGSLPVLSLVSILHLWIAFFPPNWLRRNFMEELTP